MSADLLAVFGFGSDNDEPRQQQQQQPQQPQRSNTDLTSAVNLVSVSLSPATKYVQQPWLQANTQTNTSLFGPSPSSQTTSPANSLSKAQTQTRHAQPPTTTTSSSSAQNLHRDAVGLGLSGQQPLHDSPALMEDDEWGDFETAAPATSFVVPVPASTQPRPHQPSASQSPPARNNGTARTRYTQYSDEPSRTRIARASTLDLISNSFSPVTTSVAGGKAAEPIKNNDLDVLFDADDYAHGEFDDFESATPDPPAAAAPPPPPPPQASSASVDLLSLWEPDPQPTTTAPAVAPVIGFTAVYPSQTLPSPDFGDWARLGLGEARAAHSRAQSQSGGSQLGSSLTSPSTSSVATHTSPRPPKLLVVAPQQSPAKNKTDTLPRETPHATPVTAWPSGVSSGRAPDADWGRPFKDSPVENPKPRTIHEMLAPSWDRREPAAATANAVNASTDHGRGLAHEEKEVNDEEEGEEEDQYNPSEPPPSNVPPPSVIMLYLPEVLVLAESILFRPLAAHAANPAVRERVLSDPKTLGFLAGHLAVATVAARVLAGRKLRWHRDKFLAQGMTISAAGAKGMKLTPVNKAQSVREDREAADLVAAWRRDLGRLKSAVAAANKAARAGQRDALRIPEIADAMVVQTAKLVLTSPKACVVCGLKREERVARVDIDVEDSFGEWWVEHWGHRTCRNFWKQHEQKMRQR